ncbi:MAG: hypothetical protein NC299_05045 [Lachnospiraceae bacterium]|nr:hypothetical protein [Ruminococcus sp.]MCM1274717.1 hypothetical protein [Lachnospiraceae bacterium]
MQFLYVFGLMFISIFGLAALLHSLAKALLDGASREFDVYVKNEEDIDDFIENARHSPFIGKIYIIVDGSELSGSEVGGTGR